MLAPEKLNNVNDLYDAWTLLDNELSEDDFVMVDNDPRIDEATLNYIVAQLKKQDLSKLKTAEDVIKAVNELIPGAEITAEQRSQIKTSLEKFMRNEKIKGHAKVAMALALTAGAWYFGGPIGDVAARSIFAKGYGLAFGIPSKLSLSYWLSYVPMLSHVGNLGYRFGAPVLSTVAAPVYYGATAVTKFAANKVVGAGSYLLHKQKPAQDDVKLRSTIVDIAQENQEIIARPRSKTI